MHRIYLPLLLVITFCTTIYAQFCQKDSIYAVTSPDVVKIFDTESKGLGLTVKSITEVSVIMVRQEKDHCYFETRADEILKGQRIGGSVTNVTRYKVFTNRLEIYWTLLRPYGSDEFNVNILEEEPLIIPFDTTSNSFAAGSINVRSKMGKMAGTPLEPILVEWEVVSIPLGRFNCIKLTTVHRISQLGTMIKETWYSPIAGKVKHVVKRRRKNKDRLISSSVLTSIKAKED